MKQKLGNTFNHLSCSFMALHYSYKIEAMCAMELIHLSIFVLSCLDNGGSCSMHMKNKTLNLCMLANFKQKQQAKCKKES